MSDQGHEFCESCNIGGVCNFLLCNDYQAGKRTFQLLTFRLGEKREEAFDRKSDPDAKSNCSQQDPLSPRKENQLQKLGSLHQNGRCWSLLHQE